MAQAGNTGWFAGLLKSFVAVEVKATLTAAACFLAVGIVLGAKRSKAAALAGQVVAQAVTPVSSPPPLAKRLTNAPTTAFGRVYSPDLRTFAANLRRIHCPELTVKDVRKAFHPQTCFHGRLSTWPQNNSSFPVTCRPFSVWKGVEGIQPSEPS